MKITWLDTTIPEHNYLCTSKKSHYIGPAIEFEQKEIDALKKDINLRGTIVRMLIIKTSPKEIETINIDDRKYFWHYKWSKSDNHRGGSEVYSYLKNTDLKV